MTLTRRSLLAAGAAVPLLGRAARAASGRLVYGLSSYPPTFAPFANAGSAAAAAKLMVHRGLLGYGPDGTLRGELAQSWSHDPADGAWVFHLRDAVFHNGHKVTAADIAWTIEQVAAPTSTAYMRKQLQEISKIDVPDAQTVRLHTKSPNATLPLLFAGFYLPMVQKGSLAANPIGMGAGPFVMTRQERGVALEFAAFDKFYRAPLPKLAAVRMVAYADENARVAALQAGDVDLIEYVPWQSMSSIEKNPKLRLLTTLGPFMYLTFNGRKKPFADPRVRLAVAYAVKRDDVVKAAFFGRGAPLGGVPIPPGTPFYDAKYANAWTYDPARAKALLAQAGYGGGFSCKLLSTAQYGMHKDTATVVQQYLGAIGIKAELVLPDWATRVAMGNRGQFEIAVMGTAADSNDPDGLAGLLAGNLPMSYERSQNIDIPAIDKLIAAGRAEFNDAKRHAIYDEVQKLVVEQAPIVGLCWRSQGYAEKATVQGFANMPGALTFYSPTTLEQTTIG
ncbi:MAG TPA: ABC transporter substrate-binding protein [Casimicrobiaceae bacterium]